MGDSKYDVKANYKRMSTALFAHKVVGEIRNLKNKESGLLQVSKGKPHGSMYAHRDIALHKKGKT